MEITWDDFWRVFRDILLPESGRLIWSVVLYGVLSFVVAVILLAVGQKYKAFTRNQKYYNWAVKLYIPLILLGTIFFGLQIGLFRGVYKVMDDEAELITEGIYSQTMDRAFSTQEEKDVYLTMIKVAMVTYNQSSAAFADTLKQMIMDKQVGVGLIDQAKDNVSAYLIDTYKDDIFNAIVAGIISEASKKGGEPLEVSWSESRKLLEILQRVDVAELEIAIQEKVTEMLQNLFYSQYSGMRKSSLITWFLVVLLVPILEWIIYIKWLRAWIVKRAALKRDQSMDEPSSVA